VSRVIALADRIDTLVGCFAIGLQPTGTADPYALRRATIGVLRTLLESGGARYASLDLLACCTHAYANFSGKKLDLSELETVAKLGEFMTERLRGLLEGKSGRGAADAVLAGHAFVAGKGSLAIEHPVYAQAKAKALGDIVADKAPWLEKARTVAKRLSGISKEAAPELVNKSELSKPTDQAIVELVRELDDKTKALVDEASVRTALRAMGTLAEQVDKIFVETLVNDPADASTPKRLALLSFGAHCMLRIADFSRLA
jgi:glycyl-tRNA synthetase beta chain